MFSSITYDVTWKNFHQIFLLSPRLVLCVPMPRQVYFFSITRWQNRRLRGSPHFFPAKADCLKNKQNTSFILEFEYPLWFKPNPKSVFSPDEKEWPTACVWAFQRVSSLCMLSCRAGLSAPKLSLALPLPGVPVCGYKPGFRSFPPPSEPPKVSCHR